MSLPTDQDRWMCDDDSESTIEDYIDDSSESTLELDDDDDDNDDNSSITGLAAHVRCSHAMRRTPKISEIATTSGTGGNNSSTAQEDIPSKTNKVRFGGLVRQRCFRMTMGKNPCASGIPVELSWDYSSSLRPDDILCSEDEEDNNQPSRCFTSRKSKNGKQRRGLRRITKEARNRIALRNHSTGSVLDLMDEMKEIRCERKKSANE